MNKNCPTVTLCILTLTTFSSGGLINKGIVTDTITNEPVSGVLVQVSGTGITGTTDAQGKFSLDDASVIHEHGKDNRRLSRLSLLMRGSGMLYWQAREGMTVKLFTTYGELAAAERYGAGMGSYNFPLLHNGTYVLSCALDENKYIGTIVAAGDRIAAGFPLVNPSAPGGLGKFAGETAVVNTLVFSHPGYVRYTAKQVAADNGDTALVVKLYSGKPDSTNTGAHSSFRTDPPALTVVPGEPSYTSGTPASPVIIRDKDFTGGITGHGTGYHDIQFINCRFRNDGTTDQVCEIHADNTQTVKFIDCTFAPTSPIGRDAFVGDGVELVRCRFYNVADALKNIGDHVTVESCILDNTPTARAVNGTHGDGIQVSNGPDSHTVFRNTVFYGGTNDCIFADANDGNKVTFTNWIIDKCWFYPGSGNGWQTSVAIGASYSNFSVTNCRFQRTGWQVGLVSGGIAPRWSAWSNNVYDDNGEAIPAQ
jgi:hypothetical protein